MTGIKDLWLESQFRNRINAPCEQLGWKCGFEAWECLVWPEHRSVTIYAAPRSIESVHYAEFRLAVLGGFNVTRPCAVEVLEFLLRRNADLLVGRWCFSRYEGIAFQSAYAFASLTADSLRNIVNRMLKEQDDFLALAEAECPEERQSIETPAG